MKRTEITTDFGRKFIVHFNSAAALADFGEQLLLEDFNEHVKQLILMDGGLHQITTQKAVTMVATANKFVRTYAIIEVYVHESWMTRFANAFEQKITPKTLSLWYPKTRYDSDTNHFWDIWV